MIVIASANGNVGMEAAMAALRAGGSALDAVEAGTKVVELNLDDHSVGVGPRLPIAMFFLSAPCRRPSFRKHILRFLGKKLTLRLKIRNAVPVVGNSSMLTSLMDIGTLFPMRSM